MAQPLRYPNRRALPARQRPTAHAVARTRLTSRGSALAGRPRAHSEEHPNHDPDEFHADHDEEQRHENDYDLEPDEWDRPESD